MTTPETNILYLLAGVTAIAVIVAAYFSLYELWLWWRRRKRKRPATEPEICARYRKESMR